MAQKIRSEEKWFMLMPDFIWQEHKTPQADTYVPKTGVRGWSLQIVKAAQYIIIFVVKNWRLGKTYMGYTNRVGGGINSSSWKSRQRRPQKLHSA